MSMVPGKTPVFGVLRRSSFEDFKFVHTWPSDEESFRLWTGPNILFRESPEQTYGALDVPPYTSFALVLETNEIVGFGQFADKEPGLAHLARLIVAPQRRGFGYGRLLCRLLMEEARRSRPGLHGFTLFVRVRNTQARALYESLGFREVARAGDRISMAAPMASVAG